MNSSRIPELQLVLANYLMETIFIVKESNTSPRLELSPDSIHQLGLQEVARIKTEMNGDH